MDSLKPKKMKYYPNNCPYKNIKHSMIDPVYSIYCIKHVKETFLSMKACIESNFATLNHFVISAFWAMLYNHIIFDALGLVRAPSLVD